MSDIAYEYHLYTGGFFKTSGDSNLYKFSEMGIEKWSRENTRWELDNSFLTDVVLGNKDVKKCYDVFTKKEKEFLRPFMKEMPADWSDEQARSCIVEFYTNDGYMTFEKNEEVFKVKIPENAFLKFSDSPGKFFLLELRDNKITLGSKKEDEEEEICRGYYSD